MVYEGLKVFSFEIRQEELIGELIKLENFDEVKHKFLRIYI